MLQNLFKDASGILVEIRSNCNDNKINELNINF